MKRDLLITLNPGSSTIKFGLFVNAFVEPRRIGGGMIDLRHSPLQLHLADGSEHVEHVRSEVS